MASNGQVNGKRISRKEARELRNLKAAVKPIGSFALEAHVARFFPRHTRSSPDYPTRDNPNKKK